MMFENLLKKASLAAVGCSGLSGAIQLWESPADIPNSVPAVCRAALIANITCDPILLTADQALANAALTEDVAAEYCTTACAESINMFQSRVDSACGRGALALWHESTLRQSPWHLASGLAWAYELSCIEDDTGFCLADLYNGTKEVCSDCALQYGAVMVSTHFGRARMSPESFEEHLSSCSVPAASYSWTSVAGPSTTQPPTSASSEPPRPSCTGETHVVTEDDTCISIAEEYSVGTDNMVEFNELDFHCHSLVEGMELCIQDTCTLREIEEGMTCDDITADEDFERVQLISWNPIIHRDCDNLDALVGRSICVSPPGGGDFSYSAPVMTGGGRPTLSDPMFSSWEDVEYQTDFVANATTHWDAPPLSASPTLTTAETINATHASLEAERTIYCWLTEEDFDNGFHEEDLPAACLSFVNTYCYPNVNAPIPPSPARIPPGCTPNRDNYYVPPTGTAPVDEGLTTPTPSSSPTEVAAASFKLRQLQEVAVYRTLAIIDQTALETEKLLWVYLDTWGNVVRAVRIGPGELQNLSGAWEGHANLVDHPEWDDCEDEDTYSAPGVKYTLRGELGKELYGIEDLLRS